MTKDVANNVANEKVQDLTEQWKNGELEGEYYIETHDGKHYVCELQTRSGVKNKRLPLAKSFNGYVSNKSVAKILAPVPSYEEYSRLEWYAGCGHDRIVELNHENRKLKELLKECRDVIYNLIDDEPCWLDHHGYCQTHGWMSEDLCPNEGGKELLTKIDEVLK